jgi:hypothetical protein
MVVGGVHLHCVGFSRLERTQPQIKTLERFRKYRSHSEPGFLTFGEWCRSSAFGEGAGLNNPVTEPKRSQKLRGPASFTI